MSADLAHLRSRLERSEREVSRLEHELQCWRDIMLYDQRELDAAQDAIMPKLRIISDRTNHRQ